MSCYLIIACLRALHFRMAGLLRKLILIARQTEAVRYRMFGQISDLADLADLDIVENVTDNPRYAVLRKSLEQLRYFMSTCQPIFEEVFPQAPQKKE